MKNNYKGPVNNNYFCDAQELERNLALELAKRKQQAA